MIALLSNPTFSRGAPFLGAQKGYDFFFQNYSYRFMCRAIGGDPVAAANNAVVPFSSGVYRSYRGLDFNGSISSYPDFPNGASTITDDCPTMSRGLYPTTGTFTNITIQSRYILDKSAYEALIISKFARIQTTMNISGVSGYASCSNVIPTFTFKKVSKTGTITTLKTVVGSTQSLANVGTITYDIIDNSSVAANIDEGDLFYVELSVAIGSITFGNNQYPTYRFGLNDMTLNLSIENA